MVREETAGGLWHSGSRAKQLYKPGDRQQRSSAAPHCAVEHRSFLDDKSDDDVTKVDMMNDKNLRNVV